MTYDKEQQFAYFNEPVSLSHVPLPRFVKATHCKECHKVNSMSFTDGKEHKPTDRNIAWIPRCACPKEEV